MVNSKSRFVIDKHDLKGTIHVVGVGAVGSQVVERLTRLNLSDKITVYDYDVVEEKNLNNQAYVHSHIGMKKVDAIKELSLSIDPESKLKTRDSKVEYLPVVRDNDIVILSVDNYHARGHILSKLVTNPLVITGGVSSIGGNVETYRGKEHYLRASEEYLSMESGQEYDENDLSACGSPISIYHRIGVAASLICDEIVANHSSKENICKNVMFDVPNLLFIEAKKK